MGKFVRIPDKVKKYLDEFGDLFAKPSSVSFSQLMSAIAVCDKQKNLYNLYDTMALEDKKNRSSYNWFFNNAKGMKTRLLIEKQRCSSKLWV